MSVVGQRVVESGNIVGQWSGRLRTRQVRPTLVRQVATTEPTRTPKGTFSVDEVEGWFAHDGGPVAYERTYKYTDLRYFVNRRIGRIWIVFGGEAEELMVANARLLTRFADAEGETSPVAAVPVTVWVKPESAGR